MHKRALFLLFTWLLALPLCFSDTAVSSALDSKETSIVHFADQEFISKQIEHINNQKLISNDKAKEYCWKVQAKSSDGNCLKRLNSKDLEFIERSRLAMATSLDKSTPYDFDYSKVIESTNRKYLDELPAEKLAMVKLVLAHQRADQLKNEFENLKFAYLQDLLEGKTSGQNDRFKRFIHSYNGLFATSESDKLDFNHLKSYIKSHLPAYTFLKMKPGHEIDFNEDGKPQFSKNYMKKIISGDLSGTEKFLARGVLQQLYPEKSAKLLPKKKINASDFSKEVVEIGGVMIQNHMGDDGEVSWDQLEVIDTAEDYRDNIVNYFQKFSKQVEEVQRTSNQWNSLTNRMKEVSQGGLANAVIYGTAPLRYASKAGVSSVNYLKSKVSNNLKSWVPKSWRKATNSLIDYGDETNKANDLRMIALRKKAEKDESLDAYNDATADLFATARDLNQYGIGGDQAQTIMKQVTQLMNKIGKETDSSITKMQWATAGSILAIGLAPLALPTATGGGLLAGSTKLATFINVGLIATPLASAAVKVTVDKYFRDESVLCSMAKHLPEVISKTGFTLGTLGFGKGLGHVYKGLSGVVGPLAKKLPFVAGLSSLTGRFAANSIVTKVAPKLKWTVGTAALSIVPITSVKSAYTSAVQAYMAWKSAGKEKILPASGEAKLEEAFEAATNTATKLIDTARQTVGLAGSLFNPPAIADPDKVESVVDTVEEAVAANTNGVVEAVEDVVEEAVVNNGGEVVSAVADAVEDVVEETVINNGGEVANAVADAVEEVVEETVINNGGEVADAVADAVEEVVTANSTEVTNTIADKIADVPTDSFAARLNNYIRNKANTTGATIFKKVTTSALSESVSEEDKTLTEKAKSVADSTLSSVPAIKVGKEVIATLTPEEEEVELKADILLANSLKKVEGHQESSDQVTNEPAPEESNLDKLVDLVGTPEDFLKEQKSEEGADSSTKDKKEP